MGEGGEIPRESSWVLKAQKADWSGGIILRILENRGHICQVLYWEASWKQYKWIVTVQVWRMELLFRILEHPVNESQAHSLLARKIFCLSVRKLTSFVNASK